MNQTERPIRTTAYFVRLRCQERAYDDPALRESVAQYIHLIRKLTGTDMTGVYMRALRELILGSNNLVLVHDLNEAMFEAKVSLLTRFWEEIDAAVRERIRSLPQRTEESASEKDIREFLRKQRGEHYLSLYYPFGAVVDIWPSRLGDTCTSG